MLGTLLSADGLLYIGLKAARDFVVILAGTVGADTFANTPHGWQVALAATTMTTIFRLVREIPLGFSLNGKSGG